MANTNTAPDALSRAHLLTPDEVLRAAGADLSRGLTSHEASERLKAFGANSLPAEKPISLFTLVLEQISDPLVLILIGSMAISLVLAMWEDADERLAALCEPLTIFLILVLNATVGILQERSAESAVAALKSFQAETAVVLRDGVLLNIPAENLVVGDTVEVAVGMLIPADCRVVALLSPVLKVDQSVLTGENEPVSKGVEPVTPLLSASGAEKKATPQDKTNIVFSGTNVTRGKARLIVVSTGLKTEIGAINTEIQESSSTKSPMQKNLDAFGSLLTKTVLCVCVVVWVINIPNFRFAGHGSLFRGALFYFKTAVSLAVAAVPEGLPAVITTSYSLGVSRLSKKNAIIRSLPSVETLGCTSVICSDKTGTLTTNQMSIQRFAFVERKEERESSLSEWRVEGSTYEPKGNIKRTTTSASSAEETRGDLLRSSDVLNKIMMVATLCNDATISVNATSGRFERVGEPTEASLVVFSEKLFRTLEGGEREGAKWGGKPMSKSIFDERYERVKSFEFTRSRKSMSVLCREKESGKLILFVKGAFERVVEKCITCAVGGSDERIPMSAVQSQLSSQQKLWSSQAFRCLAMGFKSVSEDEANLMDPADVDRYSSYEDRLIFVGAVAIIDPPREEVSPAVLDCRTAHIRVVMCTGDNVDTALAICRSVGIVTAKEEEEERTLNKRVAVTGTEFEAMSPAEQREVALSARCFARVEPKHKKLLVDILQKHGDVVAMTGDGVNDSPALKAADIGVGMGSGTSVARNASKMILTDDNFATIVRAVEEGRSIFANTKAFIRYLITSNIGEVIAVAAASLLGFPELVKSVQLLFVNLVTDGLPATALSFNEMEVGVMSLPPRSKDEKIVSRATFLRFLSGGAYCAFAVIASFAFFFLFDPLGPQMSWWELTHFHEVCPQGSSCAALGESNVPQTMAVSALVVVEMFCALCAVSSTQSLFTVPFWRNGALVAAVLLSLLCHVAVLHIPTLQFIFAMTPLSLSRWMVVIFFSLPVVAVEELWKWSLRH